MAVELENDEWVMNWEKKLAACDLSLNIPQRGSDSLIVLNRCLPSTFQDTRTRNAIREVALRSAHNPKPYCPLGLQTCSLTRRYLYSPVPACAIPLAQSPPLQVVFPFLGFRAPTPHVTSTISFMNPTPKFVALTLCWILSGSGRNLVTTTVTSALVVFITAHGW